MNRLNKALVKSESVMYVFTVLMFTPTCKLHEPPFTILNMHLVTVDKCKWKRFFFCLTLVLDTITIHLAKQSHRAMRFRIRLIEFHGELNSHYDHLNHVSAQSIWIRLYRINEHFAFNYVLDEFNVIISHCKVNFC